MAKVEADEVASAFLSKQSQYDRHPYFAIPLHLNRHRSKLYIHDSCCNMILTFVAMLFFLSSLGYLLYPSKPEVKIVDIQLNHVNGSKSENIFDLPTISMDLKIQLRNRDFVVREYKTIIMLLEYAGKWQGNTTADGVSVDARSTSFLELNTQFDLNQLLEDTLPRNVNVTNESISLGIAIHIGGQFQFLMFNVLVNGGTSCTIGIDADNQALNCQECCTKKT